ncbi:MAG: L-ribulose-5-phosphate 4-epimerase [Clostridia bacterium]|nr:L-ribulose-5-phosphate 4-epimerase [Clostridia bacterium]
MDVRELKRLCYEANMELQRRGLIVYTWGNVSQVDRERGIFAIKPSGVPYEELKSEMMVLVDIETGKHIDEGYKPSSDTPTHLELYRAFADIGGVTHTHSAAATSWAQACRSVPCFGTTHADYFRGEVPVTRVLTKEEVEEAYEANTGKVIIETFAGRNPVHTPGVLCAGHGPFTWGRDAADSVHNAVVLEELSRMAMWTLAINPSAESLPEHVADKHFLRKHGPNAYYGQ